MTAQMAQTHWTTSMWVKRPGGCTLYPSLRGTSRPLTAGAWHVPRNHRVGWRYQVNGKWTLVLDHSHHIKGQPHWAFLETACLKGNSYPANSKDSQGRVRNLWGKASKDWRHVDFGQTRSTKGRDVGTRKVGAAYTTMRDRPSAFVTSNLFRGAEFKNTNRCTSHSNNAWVYGMDLRAHRWGWVPSNALRGNPCLHMR
ncbi:hypothetical protein [Streptomyces chrestomyceticus]|uniref:hypothetical protein n=1 Tax=Streptomyces chrestomyceticus TaxID=68185 RepID=UPI0033E4480C